MNKTIKKAISVLAGLSMMFTLVPPVFGSVNINMGFKKSSGGGADPIVKAKWEMNNLTSTFNGGSLWTGKDDDLLTPGAQFIPPGVWNATRDIVYCAVVTDPDGIGDINAVYANVFYPPDRAFHPEDPAHPDQPDMGMCKTGTSGIDNASNLKPDDTHDICDFGLNGCHEQVGDEIQLTEELTKAEGIELFCNRIKNGNNNLPTFGPKDQLNDYNYNEICNTDGELQKETAIVWCGVRTLTWEDPAGDYWVKVHAVDVAGLPSAQLMNKFTYLELTSFETDFNSISWGDVKLNTHKIKNGDLTWGNGIASVRNLGNTRLHMWTNQDDMFLGTTNGSWNVEYDARVGSDVDFIVYDPFQNTRLEDILDLSQLEEMDFSIEVFKFPPGTGPTYSGTMTLSATRADFRQCHEDTFFECSDGLDNDNDGDIDFPDDDDCTGPTDDDESNGS